MSVCASAVLCVTWCVICSCDGDGEDGVFRVCAIYVGVCVCVCVLFT